MTSSSLKFVLITASIFWCGISTVLGQVDYKSLSLKLCEHSDISDSAIIAILKDEQIEIGSKNYKNKFNTFQFLLQKETGLNCPQSNFKGYNLLYPDIVDTDSTFTDAELEKIVEQLNKLKSNNGLELLVVTTNDYYPFEDKEGFSFDFLYRNKNEKFKNHTILVINKSKREVRFSTTEETKEVLTDQFLQGLLDDVLTPNFKQANYYSAVTKVIEDILKETGN